MLLRSFNTSSLEENPYEMINISTGIEK